MEHYLHKHSHSGIQKLVDRYELSSKHMRFQHFKENEFLLIADYYDKERFQEEAFLTVERGIANHPHSKILKTKQIRLLIQYNHPNLAKELLQKKDAAVLTPSDIDLLDAEQMIGNEEFESALSKLDLAKRKYHQPSVRSDIFVLEGIIYEKLNQYDLVFKSISEALYYCPTHENALLQMLFCVEFTKKHKQNILLHKELLQKEHYSALTWYSIGHSFYHEFMYKEAEEAFEFAYIIDSNLDAAYYFCGEINMLRGIYTKAIECYDELLNRFTVTKPEVYINLAKCHIKTGNSNLAIGYLKFAAQLEDDPDVFLWLGEAYRHQNNFEQAEKYYLEALEMDESREDVHVQLATLFFNIGEFEKSEYHFEIAVTQAPEMSDYSIQYASLFLNIGELEKAEIVLNDALQHNHCSQLLFCQAACLMLLGKKKLSINTIDTALKLDKNQQDIIFEFAPELEDNPSIKAILRYYNNE